MRDSAGRAAAARGRTTGILCLGATVLLVLSGCTVLREANDAGGGASPQESVSPDSANRTMVALYWAQDFAGRDYLFREFRALETTSAAPAGDVVATAVAMMASRRPTDPDYTNRLCPPRSVGSTVADDGTLTLDVSADIFPEEMSTEDADTALQQLVYTATATATSSGIIGGTSSPSVRILVDGRHGYRLGENVLGDPVQRDQDRRAPLWVIDPAQDEETEQRVNVKMVAGSIARKVHWDLRRGQTDVDHGTVSLAEERNGQHEIQFSRYLEPGRYTIRLYALNAEVWDHDQAESGKNITFVDDHEFTVRG